MVLSVQLKTKASTYNKTRACNCFTISKIKTRSNKLLLHCLL